MTGRDPAAIPAAAAGVGPFLAHALELEGEAAVRYEELADSMDSHNNAEVAGLFRRLGEYSRRHMAEVEEAAKAHGPLPRIAPWEFDWITGAESPEAAATDGAHYLMRAHHALQMALCAEEQGRNFYAAVATTTADPEVARLARAFAEEEAEHVELVRQWLDRFSEPRDGWDHDPDPPNVTD